MKHGRLAGLIAAALALGALLTGCPGGGEEPGTEADIASFIFAAANNDALEADVEAAIGTDGAVAATVPHGADVTALVPTITIPAGATVAPESGVAQDFTNPVTYTVTAEDGETSAEFTVTVTIAPADPDSPTDPDASTACDITGFIFEASENTALSSDVTASVGTGTVSAEVPFGTDRSALVPTITVSDAATVDPASGVAQDFSGDVTYTVTAEDATTTQEYTVAVTEAAFQEVDNTFDPDTLVQQLEHGTINFAGDYFGGTGTALDTMTTTALSADGSTIAIGSPLWHDAGGAVPGAVFVFEYDAGTWQQTAQLTGSKAEHGDALGRSVAISRDGSVIVVGAPVDAMSSPAATGLVYVFERSGSSWSDTTEDAILSTTIAEAGDDFGFATAISGDGSVIAAGAQYASNNGSADEGQAYVFLRPSGGWSAWVGGDTETARLEMSSPEAGAHLGASIAISVDGSLVVAGAPYHDDTQSDDGVAYLFEEPAGGWDDDYPVETVVNETAKLSGSEPGDYVYLAVTEVAMSDDASTIALGCPYYSATQGNAGAVFIYRRSGSWTDATEDEIVEATDPAASDFFGVSLSLTAAGGYLLVGAPGDNLDGTDKGSAYLFELDAGSYALATPKFREPGIVDNDAIFGQNVELSPDGSTLCVTAPGWDSATYGNQGTAFIYQ